MTALMCSSGQMPRRILCGLPRPFGRKSVPPSIDGPSMLWTRFAYRTNWSFVENLISHGRRCSHNDYIPSGTECRTSEQLATVKVLPLKRWRLLPPSSPVSMTLRDRVLGIACVVPGSGCSNTSATSTEADTGSSRLYGRDKTKHYYLNRRNNSEFINHYIHSPIKVNKQAAKVAKTINP